MHLINYIKWLKKETLHMMIVCKIYLFTRHIMQWKCQTSIHSSEHRVERNQNPEWTSTRKKRRKKLKDKTGNNNINTNDSGKNSNNALNNELCVVCESIVH